MTTKKICSAQKKIIGQSINTHLKNVTFTLMDNARKAQDLEELADRRVLEARVELLVGYHGLAGLAVLDLQELGEVGGVEDEHDARQVLRLEKVGEELDALEFRHGCESVEFGVRQIARVCGENLTGGPSHAEHDAGTRN